MTGNDLKTKLTMLRLSVAEFAAMLGTTRQTVHNLLNYKEKALPETWAEKIGAAIREFKAVVNSV
ncbi:MAG TPA: hypothetical protein PLN42_12120 [Anaerolineae bacterium]|nr:hypothetical protein [Anaerolineae bacterium]